MKTILTSLGGCAVLVGALVFPIKAIITTWLSKSVESFKIDLLHFHNIEMERFRQALQIQTQQEISKTITLQQRQADAGPQLCRFLRNVMTHADLLLEQDNKAHPAVKSMIDNLDKMHDAFWESYSRNYIYFPDVIIAKIDQIHTPLTSIVAYLKFEALEAIDQRSKFQPIVDAWIRDKAERINIYVSIETKIQKILGVP